MPEPLHLDWPGLLNARDLGGLPADGGTVRPDAYSSFPTEVGCRQQ